MGLGKPLLYLGLSLQESQKLLLPQEALHTVNKGQEDEGRQSGQNSQPEEAQQWPDKGLVLWAGEMVADCLAIAQPGEVDPGQRGGLQGNMSPITKQERPYPHLWLAYLRPTMQLQERHLTSL